MLPFRVKTFRGKSRGRTGEEVVMLLDLSSSPETYYHPNLYVTSEYRQLGKSPRTIEKVLRTLGMAKMWAETRRRDFDELLISGPGLSEFDILDLVRFLWLNAADQTFEHADLKGIRVVVPFKSASGNAAADAGEPLKAVSVEEAASRIRWVAKYVEWHRRRRFDNRQGLSVEELHLNSSAVKSIASLQDKAPPIFNRSNDEARLEAPDPEVLDRIEAILTPGGSENPYKSAFVQHRNYLAWRMLRDSGARRNEVTTAATDSVVRQTAQFMIRESKTTRRTVPIGVDTVTVFDTFFNDFWLNLPDGCDAHRKGELFTDAHGNPLTSSKFLNRVFLDVRPLLGSGTIAVTPHSMRRAWNYLLSFKVDQLPEKDRPSREMVANLRRRIMGWSEMSRMPGLYDKRHNREAGDKIVQTLMDRVSGGTK